MNLSDAQAFVIPSGPDAGRTIQAAASGNLEYIRERLDEEESDTPFFEALQTFIAWADGQASDDADVPPEPEADDPGEREAERDHDDGEDDGEEEYEGPLGE